MSAPIPFDNTYARLGTAFHARLPPTPVAAPRLIALNATLADALGLDREWLASDEALEVFAGSRVPDGAEPIATAYAGHQFGGFSPRLGDGRAILLGEIVGRDGRRRDIQLKGAGPTPYSRGGDGRAALGPVLREFILSEAMAALGIPTTRALAAVTTGEPVYRETPLPGAVLTRVAASHIRIGTFQFFAAQGDMASLSALVAHVLSRHYPEAAGAGNGPLALLQGVIARQAALVARWMLVGFVHGVMNTDNVSIAGETIDYGPCAFLDVYDPATVFSSIDRQGRYAFANQPHIAHWNLVRLAEALVPLLGEDQESAIDRAEAALSAFPALYQEALTAGARAKLGLTTREPDDLALWDSLLAAMAAGQADFTLTCRALCAAATGDAADLRRQLADAAVLDPWLARWHGRLARETVAPEARAASMRQANPAFIPRNHLVEAALSAAVSHQDFELFARLNAILARPSEDQPGAEDFASPPAVRAPYQTFCGT